VTRHRPLRALRVRTDTVVFEARRALHAQGARVLRDRLPPGVERVYHLHIRKTGGTTVNAAFWALGGRNFADMLGRRRIVAGDYVFVRHHAAEIERGAYFYASSHRPLHTLNLPRGTFTVTVLRDPVSRLAGHYRTLCQARDAPESLLPRDLKNRLDPTEQAWLGDSFGDFVRSIAPEHRARQLFMFSPTFDVAEAVERIDECDAVLWNDDLAADVARLGARLGFPLQAGHERRSPPSPISDADIAMARELLADEYELLRRLDRP
jgi:hypothetical protein